MTDYHPMRGFVTAIGVILMLMCSGCWDLQEPAILPPVIPHYTLSGYTVDLDDTSVVLPDSPIFLEAVELLYGVAFDPLSLSSDAEGYFRIDPVYPGNYIIRSGRDGYLLTNQNLTIQHEDRALPLPIPRLWLSDRAYHVGTENPGGPNPLFSWRDTTFFLLGVFQGGSQADMDSVIFTCQIEDERVSWNGYFDNPLPAARTLTFGASGLYIADWHTVCLISPFDGAVLGEWRSDMPISGLDFVNGVFWSTYGHFLHYRGTDVLTVVDTFATNAVRLGPVVGKAGSLYAYDEGRNLLMDLAPDGTTLFQARLVDKETGNWIIADDMDIDRNGRLWVSDKNREMLFVFDTTPVPDNR